MRKTVAVAFAVAVYLATSATALAAGPRTDASINKEIETYIVAHPMDFVGIDKLVFGYTGEHIIVGSADVDRPMTATEAQGVVAAHKVAKAEADAAGDLSILSGIPTFQVYVSSVALSGGGRSIWGTWDFPDTWAGQGAPVDIAGTSVSMNTCVRMSNIAVWTYSTTSNPGSTNLGTLRSVQPALGVLWNINDYVSGFQSMADRGTTRVEVRRGSGCPSTVQVGAAFDYEANQGARPLVRVLQRQLQRAFTKHRTSPIYFNIWLFAVRPERNPGSRGSSVGARHGSSLGASPLGMRRCCPSRRQRAAATVAPAGGGDRSAGVGAVGRAAPPAALGTPRAGSPVGSQPEGVLAALGVIPLQRALPNRYWAALGLAAIGDRTHRLREPWRTAGCGPARPVVWEGAV